MKFTVMLGEMLRLSISISDNIDSDVSDEFIRSSMLLAEAIEVQLILVKGRLEYLMIEKALPSIGHTQEFRESALNLIMLLSNQLEATRESIKKGMT